MMITRKILETKPWWNYLEEDLQELLTEAILLLNDANSWQIKFHDYSFIVFPVAKAYEGFLKKVFFDLKFISENDYYGTRFRIGKSLNPNLDKDHRDEGWVYDDLEKFCQGKALPDQLWNAWKRCRNQVFHWFPNEQNAISLTDAQDRIVMIINAIDSVFTRCEVNLK